MTIDAQCAMKRVRRLSMRLSSSAVKLAVGMIILAAAATAVWSQTATYPYNVLYKFPQPPPSFEYRLNTAAGTLLVDPTGALYGASTYGGETSLACPSGCGEVFHLSHGKFTDIANNSVETPLGEGLSSGVIKDRAGNLFGETNTTVYEVDTKGNVTILAFFNDDPTNPEGHPSGGLTRDRAGNLLGVTFADGGLAGLGEVFKIDLQGNKTVLYQFDTSGFGATNGVVLDAAGNIYGTTQFGGTTFASDQTPWAMEFCTS